MASSARSLYKRYLEVITRWPLELSKEGRDLSVHIRARIGVLFPKGELTQVEANSDQLSSLTSEIEHLERLTGNVNKKLYSSVADSYVPATGLTLEHLNRATSTEFIEASNYLYEIGWKNRLKYRIMSMLGRNED